MNNHSQLLFDLKWESAKWFYIYWIANAFKFNINHHRQHQHLKVIICFYLMLFKFLLFFTQTPHSIFSCWVFLSHLLMTLFIYLLSSLSLHLILFFPFCSFYLMLISVTSYLIFFTFLTRMLWFTSSFPPPFFLFRSLHRNL